MGILDTTFFQRIKGYKTFGVNGIVVITGLLTALGIMPAGLDAGSISAGVNGILGGAEMILGGVNILLRFITTTPAGSSGG
jgi:predicted phage tail protein